MTEKEQEILLKDIAARLPYGVKCKISEYEDSESYITEELSPAGYNALVNCFNCTATTGFYAKPLLRPLGDMSNEEYSEYENYVLNEKDETIKFCNSLNFYGKYQFDYRGLIEIGLAEEYRINKV